MRVMIIKKSNIDELQDELNSVIKFLSEEEEVIDIKFSTTSVCNEVEYTTLLILKQKPYTH